MHLYLLSLFILSLIPSLGAVEGGASFYYLGAQGPSAGVLPDPGSLSLNSSYNSYHGRMPSQIPGVRVARHLTNLSTNFIVTAQYVSELKFLSGDYAFSLSMGIGENVSTLPSPLNPKKGITVRTSGLADSSINPIFLGWHWKNFHLIFSFAIYVPTGRFNKDELVNMGLNHWGYDPAISWTWLNEKNGFEISNWTGYIINSENKETHLKSGGEFHSEFFIGKHIREWFQLGVACYYYKQLTGDTGKGAILGSFKGRVFGWGPIALVKFKIKEIDASFDVRYYKESDVRNRLKGETYFATLNLSF